MDEESRKMWESLNNLEKAENLYGPGRNPFEVPFGPTTGCLSTIQVMSFVDSVETDQNIIAHINVCRSCREWVARFKLRRSKNGE